MSRLNSLINKAKDFKIGRLNKSKGLFNDDIRAQAAYHFIIEEFDLKDEIENSEKELNTFKEDLNDFKEMMDENPYDAGIEKAYINFRNRINEHKMNIFMKNIHGAIMSVENNIYRISKIAIPYDAYILSVTEDDIKEMFKQKCYDQIANEFEDVLDPNTLLNMYDGIVFRYMRKYQSEIFNADKMIDFLLKDSEEKKYHKIEIMTNPEQFFDGYDREDPLTYPSNEDVQDKLREAIEFDVYSEDLQMSLIYLVHGYNEDPSDYMLSLDDIISLIIDKNTPDILLKNIIDGRDVNIYEYKHENRVFYISILNKFDKQIFE